MAVESPYKLEMKGKQSGIVRISKNVKVAIILGFILIISIFAYGITKVNIKNEKIIAKNDNIKLEAATEIARIFNKEVPSKVYIPQVIVEGDTNSVEQTKIPTNHLSKVSSKTTESTKEENLSKKLKEKRIDDELKARAAQTNYEQFSISKSVNVAQPNNTATTLNTNNMPNNYQDTVDNQNTKDDPGKQIRKERYLKGAAESNEDNYLNALKKNPISPYEIKAGNIIPAAMISGINSDLPGQITAQVRENIYDTVTGEFLLIPQGTKIVGSYDSQIAYGQERVLIAWHRLIFPDGSSMDLKAMPGSDLAGYGGFKDQVNNHYLKTFGSTILMSIISAGTQAAQPQMSGSSNNNTPPTLSQIIAANLGEQISQTGNGILQKNLNIQPSLEIRPGYKFNIMVTKDMVFPGIYN